MSPLRRARQIAIRWKAAAYLDLVWMTRDYRLFLSYYLSNLLVSFSTVVALLLLAERFHGIGHWSRPEIVFLLGYSMTIRGALETFFGFNVLFISRRIGRGQFDHLIVQPQPIWISLMTEGFVPFSEATVLLFGAGMVTWATGHSPHPSGAGWVSLVLLNMAASMTVVLSFSFLIGSLAFWEPQAAEEICTPTLRLLQQLQMFPLDGLGIAMKTSLLTLAPVGFVAWFPSRALLGLDAGAGPARLTSEVYLTPIAAAILAGFAVFCFRKGLAHYERTGSQRYLSFGHRR